MYKRLDWHPLTAGGSSHLTNGVTSNQIRSRHVETKGCIGNLRATPHDDEFRGTVCGTKTIDSAITGDLAVFRGMA